MSSLKSCLKAALWGLTVLAATAQGKDVDLFNADPSATGSPPNVLFMLDNSANWNATIGGTSKKVMGHQALYDVLGDPALLSDTDTARVRVGLMHFAQGNSPKGGKVMAAVEDLTAGYQDTLKCLLYDNADCTSQRTAGHEALQKTNNAPYALMMNEAYRYFAGVSPHSGTQDGDHDPDAIAGDSTYASPQAADECARDFVVLVGNGQPDSGEDTDAESKLRDLGGVLPDDPIDVSPDMFDSNWADEYARFMASADVYQADGDTEEQNVITYVIDVHDPDSQQATGTKKGASARSWLKSIAENGDGRYFTASSASEIKDALREILDEIQAVNTVFASTTLPVSVNVRGTNLNQVYMGVFRPDGNSRPLWQGNLKLYQIGRDADTDEIYLADADGDKAENPTTGFIANGARSFWTHHSDYWAFDPKGEPESASDDPDGPVVEKGGAHQRLRDKHGDHGGHGWRRLYSCTGSCAAGSSLSGFAFDTGNSNISASELGVADTTEREQLINWVRGADVDDENGNGATSDPRPSIHGDVLHSQPAVVNYGDGAIVAYYGANDGIFHAVMGGVDEDVSTGDGYELWGFVAPEFFDRLKTLRDNEAAEFGDRPNFVDGRITTLHQDGNANNVVDGSEKLYIYLSMRRGGRFIYALDVTDYDNPKLLWRRGHDDSEYGELGQSWSAPTPIRLRDGSGVRDALVFGAGYDPATDDMEPGSSAPAHSKGRGLFVVDAETGDLIWHAGPPDSGVSGAPVSVTNGDLDYSIPSNVTAIDRDRDALRTHDRIYVGDTGGQVWRLDINSANPGDWQLHKLADLGGSPKRQFFYQPDVVYTDDGYDAVLLGSGDREHPFNEATANRFYMLKDAHQLAAIESSTDFWNRGGTITPDELYDITDNDIQDGTESERAVAEQELAGSRGWLLRLNGGEKVVSSAITLGGTVFFNTHEPAPSTGAGCTPSLGIARTYMLSFLDGSATVNNDGLAELTRSDRSSKTPGGGFLPSPTPFVVELDGKKIPGVSVGPNTHAAPGVAWDQRYRTYWFKETD